MIPGPHHPPNSELSDDDDDDDSDDGSVHYPEFPPSPDSWLGEPPPAHRY